MIARVGYRSLTILTIIYFLSGLSTKITYIAIMETQTLARRSENCRLHCCPAFTAIHEARVGNWLGGLTEI
jgi:hypothetical protein